MKYLFVALFAVAGCSDDTTPPALDATVDHSDASDASDVSDVSVSDTAIAPRDASLDANLGVDASSDASHD